MTVSNISAQNAQNIWQSMLQMKQQIDSVMKDAVNQANGDNGNPLGVSFEFSKPSELLSKLSQLQSSDPETFKSLMNDVADKLQAAADEGGDGNFSAKVLGDLAAKFRNAAETGDLSQLQPSQKPQGTGPQGAQQGSAGAAPIGAAGGAKGGGAPGGAGGSSSASSTSTTTCSCCGAKISSDATTCSKCGAVQDQSSALNIGTDSEKIVSYLLNSTEQEKNSILEVLSQLVEEQDSTNTSDSDSNDTFSSIRDLITKTFQELTQNKTDRGNSK